MNDVPFVSTSSPHLVKADVFNECYVYAYLDPRYIARWSQNPDDTFHRIRPDRYGDFVKAYINGVASCNLGTLAASVIYIGKGRHMRSHDHIKDVSNMCHRFSFEGGPAWPKEVDKLQRWMEVCVKTKVALESMSKELRPEPSNRPNSEFSPNFL